MVGNLGPENGLDFIAVRDVVNVASRLEQATRDLGCSIAVSESCVRTGRAAERFARSVELQIRGRETPLTVHID